MNLPNSLILAPSYLSFALISPIGLIVASLGLIATIELTDRRYRSVYSDYLCSCVV